MALCGDPVEVPADYDGCVWLCLCGVGVCPEKPGRLETGLWGSVGGLWGWKVNGTGEVCSVSVSGGWEAV